MLSELRRKLLALLPDFAKKLLFEFEELVRQDERGKRQVPPDKSGSLCLATTVSPEGETHRHDRLLGTQPASEGYTDAAC